MLPSLVCYADILGYQQLTRREIDAGRGEEFLRRVHKALTRAHGAVRASTRDVSGALAYDVNVLTDNIVVGYPIELSGFGERELIDVLQIFAQLQMHLAAAGFLMRGGIALGDHYMSSDVVFGPALLDAVAKDAHGGSPRLALTDAARDLVDKHSVFYGGHGHAPATRYVCRDADGVYFVSYLSTAVMLFEESGPDLAFIEQHRETVTDGLELYAGDTGVRSKYEWAARYHNFFCLDFADRHQQSSTPDADPAYGAACEEAQGLRELLINLEAFAVHPESLTSGRSA